MAGKKIAFAIDVRELKQATSDGHRYAATVSRLAKIARGQPDELVVHDFAEVYGRSKKEAEKKMRRRVKEWISKYA